VSKVEFFVNGVLKATDSTAPYSYNWDTTTVVDGAYVLYAKAYDSAGNAGQSANVSVIVKNVDATVPTVAITQVTSPTTATSQTIAGTASDNVAVASVTVQIGSATPVAAALNGNTWSFSLSGLIVGTNVIKVKATDPSGNSTTVTTSIVVETTSALTVSDALLALKIAVGKISPTTDLQSRLDVAPVINGVSVPNGKVDTGDAIVILSNVVGKIVL